MKKCKIMLIGIMMIASFFFTRRFYIPPQVLVDAGTKTFIGIIYEDMIINHINYFLFLITSGTVIFVGFYWKIERQFERIPLLKICAIVFAGIKLLCLTYEQSFTGILLYRISKPLVISNICIFLGYYFFYNMLLEIVYHIIEHRIELLPMKKYRYSFLAIFLSIVICWIPYLILFYPGTLEPDAVGQIHQGIGMDSWNAHQPLYSSFIMGNLYKIGIYIKDANLGIFLFVLLQVLLSALVFTQIVRLYEEIGVNRIVLAIIWLFFAIFPLWIGYIQLVDKDLLFSLAIAELVMWMYHMEKWNKEWKFLSMESAILFLLCLNVAYLRKNGLYVVLFVGVAIFFVWRDHRKSCIFVFLMFVATYVGINYILFSVCEIKEGSVKEALSIPFQQTARYVKEHGDEVTPIERQAIDVVLDYDKIGDAYRPFLSDDVKGTYREDSKALPLYFEIWFQQFQKHPFVYLDAALSNSYAYLYPNSCFLWAYEHYTMCENDLNVENIMPQELLKQIDAWNHSFIWFPGIHYLYTPGTYVWISIFFLFYNIIKKQEKRNILLVPSATILLTSMASPCLNAVRYALPIMLCLPIVMVASINQSQVDISKSNDLRMNKK